MQQNIPQNVTTQCEEKQQRANPDDKPTITAA